MRVQQGPAVSGRVGFHRNPKDPKARDLRPLYRKASGFKGKSEGFQIHGPGADLLVTFRDLADRSSRGSSDFLRHDNAGNWSQGRDGHRFVVPNVSGEGVRIKPNYDANRYGIGDVHLCCLR